MIGSVKIFYLFLQTCYYCYSLVFVKQLDYLWGLKYFCNIFDFPVGHVRNVKTYSVGISNSLNKV